MASLRELTIETGTEIIHVTPVRPEAGRGWTKMMWGASTGAHWNHPDTQFLVTGYNVFGRTEEGGVVLNAKYTDYPKDSATARLGLRNIPPSDLNRQNYYDPTGDELKSKLDENGLEIVRDQAAEIERWRIVQSTSTNPT